MTRIRLGALVLATCVAALLVEVPRGLAQEARAAGGVATQGADSLSGDGSGFLGRLFGREGRAASSGRSDATSADDLAQPSPHVQLAQMSSTDLVVRLDRLEAQIRQLTGAVEQLQFRNQQLEQELRRTQPESMQEPGARSGARAAAPPPSPGPNPPYAVPPPVVASPPPPGAPAGTGRRSDVFDPAHNPSAPGAPRTLGTMPASAQGAPSIIADDEPPVGAPGGRAAGAPLDLATLSGQVAAAPAPNAAHPAVAAPPIGGLPPPPPRNPNATGAQPQQMVMAPSNTPKDEYDLAYGYILRKDYALAEESLRAFLQKYPSDRMVADATYWLGESLFQRQRYRDAAEFFLAVSTKHATLAKAPGSLLRLGQSLAALKEKDAACATFAEIGRKYPRASPTVKQSAEREQKRAGC